MRVSEHDSVTVVFTGKLPNGEIFESATAEKPLSFRLGTECVLAAFEQALIGMAVNEKKIIKIAPEHAYGTRHPDLIHVVQRGNFSQNDLDVGSVVGLKLEKDGQHHEVPALVTEVNDDSVTVDFNHPLAGLELIYEITVQAIEKNDPAGGEVPA